MHLHPPVLLITLLRHPLLTLAAANQCTPFLRYHVDVGSKEYYSGVTPLAS